MTGREIRHITCSCGGEVREVLTTDTEEDAHGCNRRGCCVTAYQCSQCGTRFTVALEAPEME